MVQKVILNTSELGTICKLNKYGKISDVTEKLWKRYNRKTYIEAYESVSTDDTVGLTNYHKEQNALKSNGLENIIPKGFIKDVNNLTQLNNKKKDFIKDMDTNIQANEKKEITKLKKLYLFGQIKKDDMDKKVNQIKKQKKEEKKLIKNYIEHKLNTQHGIKQEDTALDIYIKETGVEVEQDTSLHYMQIYSDKKVDLSLCGKIDGYDMTNDKILEVKNRRYRFMKDVPKYEYAQIQGYLQMFDVDTGTLIQCYKGKFKKCIKYEDIEKDDEFWKTQIEPKLVNYAKWLVKLVIDKELYSEYFKHDVKKRDKWIYSNYLSSK